MKNNPLQIPILMALIALAGLAILAAFDVSSKAGIISLGGPNATGTEANLKSFGSYEELKEFLQSSENYSEDYSNRHFKAFSVRAAMAATAEATSGSTSSSDYSTTNIQVEGVDEADIVKNDGKYIYTINGNRIIIVDAYPASEAKIVSEIKTKAKPIEIFVNEDRLVVLEQDYNSKMLERNNEKNREFAMVERIARVTIYDISNREKPTVAREIELSGDYQNARMIGDHVYVIANQPAHYYGGGPIQVPFVNENNETAKAEPSEIFRLDHQHYSYSHSYTNVVALNIKNDEAYTRKTYLESAAGNIYVSQSNIYLINTVYEPSVSILEKAATAVLPAGGQIAKIMPVEQNEKTTIHSIKIEDGKIESKSEGTVPGHVLNQFSMDEHNGYFRIATTIGNTWEGNSKNNVYVLDDELKVVGSVEDLAPGESIYSARFMGNRAYLVTFKRVDPLFVIDLSEPANPKLLGKLKIPGYSDYLHPYDENHLIGIGKDVDESIDADKVHSEGAVYYTAIKGVKLSLFDVSDVEHPVETSKYVIGDRGTDSEALRDHKAFLFSKDRKLLVIPILLAEIDKAKYPSGVPTTAEGDFTFHGAYAFNLDAASGFQLKGRVTHLDEKANETLMKSGYYFDSAYAVKRSLYMDDVLYTISGRAIKMNSIGSLDELNSLKLPDQQTY